MCQRLIYNCFLQPRDTGGKLLRDKHRIGQGGEVSWNLYAPHRVKQVKGATVKFQ